MWIFVSKMWNRWNICGLLFIIYGISFTQSIKITWGKKPTSNIFSAKGFVPASSSFSGTPKEPATPDTKAQTQAKQAPAPSPVPYPKAPSLNVVTLPTEPPSKFEGSGIVVSNPVIMREEPQQNNRGQTGQQLNGRQRKNNRNRRPDFNQNDQQFSERRQNRRRNQQNSNRRDFQPDPIDSRPGNNFNNRPRNRQNNQRPPMDRYNNQQGQSDRFGNQQPRDRFNDRQGQRDRFNNNQQPTDRTSYQQSQQRNRYDNPPFDNQPQPRDRLNQGPMNNNQRRDRGRQGGQYNVDQGPYNPRDQTQYDFTQQPLFDPPTTLPPLQDMGGPATQPIRDPPYQPLGRQQRNPPTQVRLQRPPPMSQAIQPVSQRKPGPRNSQNSLQTPSYSFKQQQERMNRFNERAPPRPQDQYNNVQGSRPTQGQNFNQRNGPMGYPTVTPPSRMGHTTPGFNQFNQPMGNQMNGPPHQQHNSGPNQFPSNNPNYLPGQTPMAPAPGGHGPPCRHTADCEFGCCYDNKGHILDTDTYGPGKPMEGKAKGMCLRRNPGLGQVCDDLCTCQKGLDCYRRYPPDYKMGARMAQNPQFQPPDTGYRPQRKCVRKGVMLAEQWAFWKCYFDTACSGPLPN